MPSDSIEAYDAPERVQKYDADMDIMHPLRHKMLEIALDVLPFEPFDKLKVLDLGVGTEAFALRALERYFAHCADAASPCKDVALLVINRPR